MSENEIDLLIQLQSIDSQLDESEKKEKQLLSNLQEIDEKLKDLQEKLLSKKEELKYTKKEKLEKELKIKELESLLQKHEEEKYKVKSQHEFDTIYQIIANLEKEKDKEEDNLLELMEKEERLASLLPSFERKSAEEKKKLSEEKDSLNNELINLKKNREELIKEREGVAQNVNKVYYVQYEQLRKTKNGLAVVMVKDGVCGGCQIKVPPSLIGQIKRHQIVHCENCNRIIYIRYQSGS